MKQKKENKNRAILYRIFRPILKLFLDIFCHIKIIGKENIPKNGGYLLASNHLSNLDFLLMGSTTYKTVYFLAKDDLFKNKLLGNILSSCGVIPVDRKNHQNDLAKEKIKELLNDDKVIGIFPEGTTKKKKDKDKIILPFKYGVISFSYNTHKQIVPMAIIEKHHLFKYNNKLIIGKPYYVVSNDYGKEKEILENKIIELIKEGQNER